MGCASAIQMGSVIEEVGCMMFEEPVNYLNSAVHKKELTGEIVTYINSLFFYITGYF